MRRIDPRDAVKYYVRNEDRDFYQGPYETREQAEAILQAEERDPDNLRTSFSIVRARFVDPGFAITRFLDFDQVVEDLEVFLYENPQPTEFADWDGAFVLVRHSEAGTALERALMAWAREYLFIDVKQVVNE